MCKLVDIGCHTQFIPLRKPFNEPFSLAAPCTPQDPPVSTFMLRLKVCPTTLIFYIDFRDLNFSHTFGHQAFYLLSHLPNPTGYDWSGFWSVCLIPNLATSPLLPFPVCLRLNYIHVLQPIFTPAVCYLYLVFKQRLQFSLICLIGNGSIILIVKEVRCVCIFALIKLDSIVATVCLLKSS